MGIIKGTLVQVLDEAISQGFARRFNFTGAGVTATISGDLANVNIPGGAGAGWTQIEANLGSANWRGKFTVIDATVSGTSKIIIQQAPGPYTGKGTRADEAEMDFISCFAVPGSGQFTVHWRTQTMIGTDFGDVRGTQPVSSANTQHGNPFLATLRSTIIGRVKGNVKFYYTVA